VILDNLRTKIEAYIADVERTPATPDQGQAAFDGAFAATRQWTQINLEQSRAVKIIESRLDRVAGLVALAGVTVVIVGIGSVAWWLRRRTFAPALQLVGVIERYAGGERSARAAENGAQELRTIAHQFNDMASTLEQQRTNQLTFLAGVAHDLRNPLAAMKLAVTMVPPDKPLPPEPRVRQLFARIERQTARLERMVFDFLDASRIESGDLSLTPEECDVCVLVRATAELFESSTRTHRLAVSVPSCPVLVTCDPTRIEQVLSNVVSNAIKYSPAGGTVTLTVSQLRDAVEIAVTDEGVGMSADDIRHAFEPFRRFAPAAGGAPGIGLGLFVAKRIVKAHGGDISIESSPGAGATFRIRLPVTRSAPREG